MGEGPPVSILRAGLGNHGRGVQIANENFISVCELHFQGKIHIMNFLHDHD